jgi:integrase
MSRENIFRKTPRATQNLTAPVAQATNHPMAKVTVHIPHVAWRDGRPRFQPAKGLRLIGFKGQDLKRADGAWMSLAECQAWIDARLGEIERVRTARAAGKRARPRVEAAAATVAHLLDDYLRSQAVSELAPNSVRYYRRGADWIKSRAPALYVQPIASVRAPDVFVTYETAARTSIPAANCMTAVLSAAFSWARLRGHHGVTVNPCERLKRRAAPPRLRVGTPQEMAALVAAADAIGLQGIGDAIMLGLWTGQRQGDRLALIEGPLDQGRRIFRQRKTGAIVAIRATPALEARLEAARDRKRGLARTDLVVVSDAAGKAYDEHHYRATFRRVREAAVAGVRDAGTGAWLVEPTPTLDDFRDQDLRDTAVTWLARAGCTIPEICAITGHSLQSATMVLKHYLAMDASLADAGIAKLVTWHEGQTA